MSAKTGHADGTCAPVTENTDPDTECTPLAGSCQTGLCDGAGACGRIPNGAICRAAVDVCDVAEVCSNDQCPADALALASAVCRPSMGPCDVAESCTGAAATCPPDAFASSAVLCRPTGGPCDVEERCSGTSAPCPPDVLAPVGTSCRASRGVCDREETCTGTDVMCPADARAPVGTVCRPAAGVCDLAEQCTQNSDACPPDVVAPSTVLCRPSAGACDLAEQCVGNSVNCPTDAKSTSVCRPAVSVCDVAESCTGTSDACPANAVQPATTEVCAPYRCNASLACTSGACTNDNQCAPGSFCRGSVCVRGKRVFATSTTHTGAFGGLTQGDTICGSLAQSAGLPGTFKAWLSSSTVNARNRITQSTVPYFRRVGTSTFVIANNYTEFVSNAQPRAIDSDQTGTAVTGMVWTGTNNSGDFLAPNCSDWTLSSSVNGRFGTISGLTIPSWTDDGSGNCSFPRRLYCIEQ